MLNESRVLDYIKSNLGFPFQPLELTDEYIMNYVVEYTLRTWSHYFPEKHIMKLALDDDSIKANSRQNEFYLEEPEGLEILNIADMYFSASKFFALGHPYIGIFNYESLPFFALSAVKAADAHLWSPYNYTFVFVHPNIVRIMPNPKNEEYCLVEYERVQSPDFSGISNELQIMFCDLALADIKIVIGSARARYDQLQTPFGSIPLNQNLASEGKEEKRDILDKLTAGSLPNIIFDKG